MNAGPKTFTKITLHPRTIAKVVRRVKSVCDDLDWSGVNSGWVVGRLNVRQLEVLLQTNLSSISKSDVEQERICKGKFNTLHMLRQSIRNRFREDLQYFNFKSTRKFKRTK